MVLVLNVLVLALLALATLAWERPISERLVSEVEACDDEVVQVRAPVDEMGSVGVRGLLGWVAQHVLAQ